MLFFSFLFPSWSFWVMKLGKKRATSSRYHLFPLSGHLKFVTLPSVTFLVLLQSHWLSALLVIAVSDLYSSYLWLLLRTWSFTCLPWSYSLWLCTTYSLNANASSLVPSEVALRQALAPQKTTLTYLLLWCWIVQRGCNFEGVSVCTYVMDVGKGSPGFSFQ